MPIGLAVFDALDSPVRASWRRRRDALDKNSAKSFEFRVAAVKDCCKASRVTGLRGI